MSLRRLLVGESDGPAFCRELFSRLMFQFGVPAPKDLSVSGPIVLDWLGLCAIWFGVPKAACLRWMPDKVGDHSAILLLSNELFATAHDQGSYACLDNRTALLLVNATRATTEDRIEHTLLIVPNAIFVPWDGQAQSAVTRVIPRDDVSLRFLTKYLKILRESSTSMTLDLRRSIVVHVYDLIALTLGAPQDTLRIANQHGVRLARLRAIKSDVLRNLDDPEMTVSMVASRQGVTPRYIHMLFEMEGIRFSAFVLDQRLTLAHRMLCDPHCASLTVTTIAFSVGFGDLSYFDRTFRRRFGKTPSDLRGSLSRFHAPEVFETTDGSFDPPAVAIAPLIVPGSDVL